MLPPRLSSLLLAASLVPVATPLQPSVILASSTELQPRLEIRELEKDVDQWNLFLLGFKRLKEVNSTDHFSYYRLAGESTCIFDVYGRFLYDLGIHGYPFSSYDGVDRCHSCFDDIGYCPHASTLFMTWHRPHLALFEVSFTMPNYSLHCNLTTMQQTLRSQVFKIVDEYPAGEQKERYKSAAQKLRLPYWDWAKAQPPGQDILPQSVVKPTVELAGPRGKETVENPLLRYTFGADLGPPGGEDYPLPNDVSGSHFDNGASKTNKE
jgi:tyrosinase